ncbi:SRPBCC family protein [Rubrimonas cliftonensis]|uniref:Polyketide cyclase / dehydrase and lipid transport n=1 Tax=Rubrimonas cliftonensis TaxID=89524 RepID=A0A1H3W2N8_9RHOB|nr:SRPBCC family protein [Rubrimonas cliftonensis]SDZ81313.1 Polyketide cyclase / dehydrase and lipid transport [Rubrimonas cliftonensis]
MYNWSLAALAAAALAVAPMAADAHGPSRQKVTETVAVAAAPDAVWARIGNFQDMSWHPAVAQTTGEGGNAIDATRELRLGDPQGPTIDEVLYKYDAAKRTYSYRIEQVELTTLPVSNYSAHLTVKDGPNGGSVIEWRGAFYRGFPNNDPPPELSDEAVVNAVTSVYRLGLDALQAEFGAAN